MCVCVSSAFAKTPHMHVDGRIKKLLQFATPYKYVYIYCFTIYGVRSVYARCYNLMVHKYILNIYTQHADAMIAPVNTISQG